MGKITAIVGTMFAGKTTTLLHYQRMLAIQFKPYIVIKYKLAQHSGIKTHDKEILLHTHSLEYLHELDNINLLPSVTILIDEAQWFKDFETFAIKYSKKYDIIFTALTTNYLKKPYVQIMNIVAISEEYVKNKSICMKCLQDNAIYNIRLVDNSEEFLEGSEDLYQVVCRNCECSM